MKFKNIIFDCDSTLTRIEGLDEIARRRGLLGRVRGITTAGMNGDLLFSQSFRQRFEIVQPTMADLVWLGRRYIEEVVEGAWGVVRGLRQSGCQIYILTGGLYPAVTALGEFLEVAGDNIYAIEFPESRGLDPKGSNPINEVDWNRLDTFKVEVVKVINQTGPTVLVGDGLADYEAGKYADLFIGFGGAVKRQSLKDLSPIYIEEPRLQPILDIVL